MSNSTFGTFSAPIFLDSSYNDKRRVPNRLKGKQILGTSSKSGLLKDGNFSAFSVLGGEAVEFSEVEKAYRRKKRHKLKDKPPFRAISSPKDPKMTYDHDDYKGYIPPEKVFSRKSKGFANANAKLIETKIVHKDEDFTQTERLRFKMSRTFRDIDSQPGSPVWIPPGPNTPPHRVKSPHRAKTSRGRRRTVGSPTAIDSLHIRRPKTSYQARRNVPIWEKTTKSMDMKKQEKYTSDFLYGVMKQDFSTKEKFSSYEWEADPYELYEEKIKESEKMKKKRIIQPPILSMSPKSISAPTRSATIQQVRPKTDQVTHAQSATLVRNLLRTALGSICYHRGLFPERYYEDKQIAGTPLKSLTGVGDDKSAQVLNWLENGVFHAFDNNYLDTVTFVIKLEEDDNESIIESYVFKIEYDDDGNADMYYKTSQSQKYLDREGKVTKIQARKATIQMVQCLLKSLSDLPPLPHRRFFAIRLTYTPSTPADYEPPLFTSVYHDYDWFDEPKQIDVGGIETGTHMLEMTINTLLHDDAVMQTLFKKNKYLSMLKVPQDRMSKSEIDRLVSGTAPTNDALVKVAEEISFEEEEDISEIEDAIDVVNVSHHTVQINIVDRVREAVVDLSSISMRKLSLDMGFTYAEVKEALATLEIEGIVKKRGNRYYKNESLNQVTLKQKQQKQTDKTLKKKRSKSKKPGKKQKVNEEFAFLIKNRASKTHIWK
ncbi:hypothetical protein PCE1_002201 [Barthelona sp. PCE]